MFFFFFNDTATTEIYTLSLHDALPISLRIIRRRTTTRGHRPRPNQRTENSEGDRKSTRLNSSHANISYAVFCSQKIQPGRRSARAGKRRPYTTSPCSTTTPGPKPLVFLNDRAPPEVCSLSPPAPLPV